jgi:hypothetical protein
MVALARNFGGFLFKSTKIMSRLAKLLGIIINKWLLLKEMHSNATLHNAEEHFLMSFTFFCCTFIWRLQTINNVL